MGRMYMIMNCGCIYSAGILNEVKLVDPAISYCCEQCYETINPETYYQIIEELSSEIDQNDISDLLKIGWSNAEDVKEYIRTHIGKVKLEKMWKNAEEIYDRM